LPIARRFDVKKKEVACYQGGVGEAFVFVPRLRAAEGFSDVQTAMKLSPRDPVRPVWEFQICHLHSHLAAMLDGLLPFRGGTR
jgi:hypothetical protein